MEPSSPEGHRAPTGGRGFLLGGQLERRPHLRRSFSSLLLAKGQSENGRNQHTLNGVFKKAASSSFSALKTAVLVWTRSLPPFSYLGQLRSDSTGSLLRPRVSK